MSAIPGFTHRNFRGWPQHPKGGAPMYLPLAELLTRSWDTDAHFAAYSTPHIPRRLRKEALTRPEAFPQGIPIALAVFDVDSEAAHRATAGDKPVIPTATDEWWVAELEKLRELLAAHPAGYIYRTRGGYRIVYTLEGVTLRQPADAETWATNYVTWVAYLRRGFGIVADPSCSDWPRLYRAPRVVRDGRAEVREVLGDPSNVGCWACRPTAEDLALAATLRRQRVSKSYKPKEERPAAFVGEGILFHAFQARGLVGAEISPGKWTVECPWASAHTSGSAHDTSTVLFAPAAGEELGWPHCSHAHCTSRDLRDWLSQFTESELDAARAAAGLPPRGTQTASRIEIDDSGKATIVVDTDENRVILESIGALAQCTGLYQRGGRLVEVQALDGRQLIRELPLARVRWLLARAANYVQLKKNRETGEMVELPCHVPDWCTRAVECAGEWPGVPRLVGVLESPALRPDGTVLQEAGFDAETGYLYIPSTEFNRVPDEPTHEDAVRARDELLEAVCDFPFAGEAHRSAWLAFTLSPFARPAIEGTSPLIAVDATTRGTGKGRLVDVAVIIATGRDAGKTPLPQDDEEMRKRITSVLRGGQSIHVFDNVARRLEDAGLDAVITASWWEDRALGKNDQYHLRNLCLWVATGNNLEFAADTARRTLHIRLESRLENPEDRDDFVHSDLLAWVRRERPRLAAAALTILRAYVVAGRPKMNCRSWGSFEPWSRLLSHAVTWVGMPDPQLTRTDLEKVSDAGKTALIGLLTGWPKLCEERRKKDGMTVKSALEYLYPFDRLRGQAADDAFEDLREAIEALAPPPPGKAPSNRILGQTIQRARGRVIAGHMFDGTMGHGGVVRWRVVTAAQPAPSATSGTAAPANDTQGEESFGDWLKGQNQNVA